MLYSYKVRCIFIFSICQLIAFVLILYISLSYNPYEKNLTFARLNPQILNDNSLIKASIFLPSLLYCDWKKENSISTKNISKLYILKGVSIITRHGERTPLHEKAPKLCHYESEKSHQIFFNDLQKYKYGNAQTVINHFFSKLKTKQCSSGQLTIRGVEQMRVIGYQLQKYRKLLQNKNTRLHTVLKKNLNSSNLHIFLSSITNNISLENKKYIFNTNISIKNKIFVQSTQISRTMLSALALLHSFISNVNKWKKIPINLITNIYHCNGHASCNCHPLTNSIAKKKLSKDELKIITEANYIISMVNAKYGNDVKFKSPGDLIDFFSNQICETTLNEQFDCINLKRNFCLPLILVNKLWKSLQVLEKQKELNNNWSINHLLLIYPLLKEITLRFANITNNKPENYTPPISIYSGHDKTLESMLDILGIKNYTWPGYASLLIFELYKYKKSHFIKIKYNNVDVTSMVKPCLLYIHNHAFCPFTNFIYFVLRDLNTQFINYCS